MRTFVLGLVLCLASVGCSKDYENVQHDTLYIGQRGHIDSIDPALAKNREELQIVSEIYETLYQYDFASKTPKLLPLLAADLPSRSKDGKTITIRLKKDIYFHEDEAFRTAGSKKHKLTAHDFVYAIKRLALIHPRAPILQLLSLRVKGLESYIEELGLKTNEEKAKVFEKKIKGLYAKDDNTIVFVLDRVIPDLADFLTHPSTAPIAREIINQYANQDGILVDHAVGTGPFLLHSFKPGAEIVLVKNKKYHEEFFPTPSNKEGKKSPGKYGGKPLPMIDYIVFKHLKPNTPDWILFKKGKLDQIELSQSEQKKLEEKKWPVRDSQAPDLYYLGFNFRDPLLRNNRNLRKAIYHSINRKEFLSFFGTYNDFALNGLYPNQNLNESSYDPILAKKYLKKAGYPEGNGLQVLRLDIPNTSEKSRQVGAFISKELSKIGIELEVHYLSEPSFEKKRQNQTLQLFYAGWTPDLPHPVAYYQILHSKGIQEGINLTQVNDREFDQLIDGILGGDIKKTSTQKKVMKFEKLITDFAPLVPLMSHFPKYATQPWVKNLSNSLWFYSRYKYVAFDQNLKKELN